MSAVMVNVPFAQDSTHAFAHFDVLGRTQRGDRAPPEQGVLGCRPRERCPAHMRATADRATNRRQWPPGHPPETYLLEETNTLIPIGTRRDEIRASEPRSTKHEQDGGACVKLDWQAWEPRATLCQGNKLMRP